MSEHEAGEIMPDTDNRCEEKTIKPKWQTLSSIDRRVIGVLAEKAKTTPAAYPLSLNAVCAACNQKSNRSPIMQLEPDDVEESLDRLREIGAVGVVQGHGRVSKFRHYLYDWLGVDKLEMAVITELLLRGDQTEGELRGRAARMEAIAGLAELRPILKSLKSKGLVISLTPEGRGHVVTHALYQPQELQRLRERYDHSVDGIRDDCQTNSGTQRPTVIDHPSQTSSHKASRPDLPLQHAAECQSSQPSNEIIEKLLLGQSELRSQIEQLQGDLEEVAERLRHTQDELQTLKNALGA